MSQFIILDEGIVDDPTLYESLQEAKDAVDENDVSKNDDIVIYKLVPMCRMRAPSGISWESVEKSTKKD